jgi:hypothetical protein
MLAWIGFWAATMSTAYWLGPMTVPKAVAFGLGAGIFIGVLIKAWKRYA